MKELKELMAQKRELSAKMAEANTANDQAAYEAAKRNYELKVAEITDYLQEENARQLQKAPEKSKDLQMREIVENAKKGGQSDFVLQREITSGIINTGDTNNMESAGFPVTVKELLEPLEVENIYDKVGLRVETGVGGTIQWPCLDTAAEVEVVGETVKLGDTDLDFSKIVPVQKRLGISISVTNESLENASFDLYSTVVNQMRKALARVINAVVVSAGKISQLVGPFANGGTESFDFEADMPSYKELLQMKGKVAGKGVQLNGFCYVMNTFTYATLEATSKTESNGGMIIENGRLGGYPVFVTDSAKIADGCVNAGCFGYAALLQHGDLHFIVDPYTKAKKNEIVFTLNTNMSLTTLKSEAFITGKASA